mmetsp:Transcript_51117/g.136653  ORF Transcript_51117/g.136653 Transcript_51117/m.136653 type:complete len:269 (+) Transcript_51117:86-892(+)
MRGARTRACLSEAPVASIGGTPPLSTCPSAADEASSGRPLDLGTLPWISPACKGSRTEWSATPARWGGTLAGQQLRGCCQRPRGRGRWPWLTKGRPGRPVSARRLLLPGAKCSVLPPTVIHAPLERVQLLEHPLMPLRQVLLGWEEALADALLQSDAGGGSPHRRRGFHHALAREGPGDLGHKGPGCQRGVAARGLRRQPVVLGYQEPPLRLELADQLAQLYVLECTGKPELHEDLVEGPAPCVRKVCELKPFRLQPRLQKFQQLGTG